MLTSGGDCQCLNATMEAIAKVLYKKNKDIEIYGILDGFAGLNYTCFFKFPFEFFQSLLDVFAFFYWNYNHNYLEISLFVSFE